MLLLRLGFSHDRVGFLDFFPPLIFIGVHGSKAIVTELLFSSCEVLRPAPVQIGIPRLSAPLLIAIQQIRTERWLLVLPSHSLHVLADRHALSGFGGHAEFIPNSPGGVTSGIRFVFACVPIETVTGGSDSDDSLLFLASSLHLLDGVLCLHLGFSHDRCIVQKFFDRR